MSAQRITIQGFLSKFVALHTNMPDRPFCWVLGSGASVQSGIPSGAALAKQWLRELHEQEDFNNLPLEKWATAKNLGIDGFDFANAVNFYPWIYQRRFLDDPDEGYAFLESKIADAEPSYGYSVLAQIMAGTRHQVAVTTNFDNLVVEALSTYTSAFPLVCDHESLSGYIRASLRRPLVVKLHRDLLLNPLNNPKEIHELPTEWSAALTAIFNNFTPIVIGYGGNDGSLMAFLKTLPPIIGGIYWCYRAGSEPDNNVHELVGHHRGRLVPILGFDELMLQLWGKLSLASPIPELEKTHKQRVAEWQKQFDDLSKRVNEPGKNPAAEEELKPVREAAATAVERITKEASWWAWRAKAKAEKKPEKAEAIYREGLKDFPESSDLIGSFALFMEQTRKDYKEAEQLYRKALEIDPLNALVTCNFADFKNKFGSDNNEAERLFRKAVELDPTIAYCVVVFANFMNHTRKDYDEAERLYRKALELDPTDAYIAGNFALFMKDIRKNWDEAERLLRKVLELDPTDAYYMGNFARFMTEIRKDYEEADRLYRKTLELEPDDEFWKERYEDFKKEHKGGKK